MPISSVWSCPRRRSPSRDNFAYQVMNATFCPGHFENSLSLIYRDVGVRRTPRGLRQAALSISCLSPIARGPDALVVTKIASLIFRRERGFLALSSFHSLRRPSFSFGSSSLISLRRHCLSLSRPRLRPPGNIQRRSRLRLTRSTRPRLATTSFEDFAMSR
jgi:hypothetical protein